MAVTYPKNTGTPPWVPGVNSTTGAPTTGTWNVGQVVVDSATIPWECVMAGTPGTWVCLLPYVGYMTSWGVNAMPGQGASIVPLTSAGDILIISIPIMRPMSIAAINWRTRTTSTGNYDVGIYTADGQTKLWSLGDTANPGANTNVRNAITGVTNRANEELLLAFTFANITQTVDGQAAAGSAGIIVDGAGSKIGRNITRTPYAALPATITPGVTGFAGTGLPNVFFEFTLT